MKKIVVALLACVFCTIVAQNATAQSNLGLERIGVEAGLVNADNIDATLGFGGFAELGTIAPRVALSTHLGYWSHSENIPGGGDAKVRDIAVSLRGKYLFPVARSTVQPFMGAGVGMHFLSAEFDVPGFPTMEDSQTKIGLDLGGGIVKRMNASTDFHVEMWYGLVEDFSQLSVKAGLAFKLGK